MQRAWIEFASATLDNIGSLYNVAGEKNFTRAADQLGDKWRQLEQVLGESTFFSGEEFSLVDAAFAPVFRYLDLFEQLVDLEFLGTYTKIARWRNAMRRGINCPKDWLVLPGRWMARDPTFQVIVSVRSISP